MTASPQQHTIQNVPGARTPAIGGSGVFGRDALALMVRDSVRQIRDTAIGLTPTEQQLLKDLCKGRYIGGVLNALELSQQKCTDITGATALPEAFRGWVVGGHPGYEVCLFDSFLTEQHANGTFDLTQFEYLKNPTKANRDRAIEAGNRQLVETRRALDALHQDQQRERMTLLRG